MTISDIPRTKGYKLNALFLMSIVKGAGGELLAQSDVASIAYRVIDSEDSAASAATGSLTVASVIFNTQQTTTDDSRWPDRAPVEGYNFGGEIPGTAFANGNTKYWVEVTATLAAGGVVTLYGGIHQTFKGY